MFAGILLILGCIVLGLGLVGMLLLLWASWRAPEGREDERGFHRLPSSELTGPTGQPAPDLPAGLDSEDVRRGTPVTR